MFAGLIKIVKKAKNKVKAVLRRRKKSRLFLDSVARRKVQGNASLLPHTLRSAPDARRKAGKKAAPNAEIVLKNFSGVQLSPHTKRAYERDLKEFVFYLKKNQELEAWYLLTPSDLAAYRDHLIGRKIAFVIKVPINS